MRLAILVLLAGCYSATIHVAPRPLPAMPVIADAWHVSIFGIFELSDPANLGLCPVTDIYEEQSLAAALVGGLFGVGIMDTTINCPLLPPPTAPRPWSGPPGGDQ